MLCYEELLRELKFVILSVLLSCVRFLVRARQLLPAEKCVSSLDRSQRVLYQSRLYRLLLNDEIVKLVPEFVFEIIKLADDRGLST